MWQLHHPCMIKLPQSCLTLCDPMDCSLPGSSYMGFSKQEYWSGLPCLPLGDLPDLRIEPSSLVSPALHVDSLPLAPPFGKPNITPNGLKLWRGKYIHIFVHIFYVVPFDYKRQKYFLPKNHVIKHVASETVSQEKSEASHFNLKGTTVRWARSHLRGNWHLPLSQVPSEQLKPVMDHGNIFWPLLKIFWTCLFIKLWK